MIAYDITLYNPESGSLPLGSIDAILYGFIIILSMLLCWKFLDDSLSWIKILAVMFILVGLGMNAASELPIFGTEMGESSA